MQFPALSGYQYPLNFLRGSPFARTRHIRNEIGKITPQIDGDHLQEVLIALTQYEGFQRGRDMLKLFTDRVIPAISVLPMGISLLDEGIKGYFLHTPIDSMTNIAAVGGPLVAHLFGRVFGQSLRDEMHQIEKTWARYFKQPSNV